MVMEIENFDYLTVDLDGVGADFACCAHATTAMEVLPLPAGPVIKRLLLELATSPRVCNVASGRTSPDIAKYTALGSMGARAALWRTTMSVYADSDTGAGPM